MNTARERTEKEYLEASAMIRMADHFDALASGRIQVPRQTVRTRFRDQIEDPAVLRYHDIMVEQTGSLFLHFLASVPCILEEMSRIGVALTRLAQAEASESTDPFTFYELDAFDGTSGRSLAAYSEGLIHTFCNSPNKANHPHFLQHANPAHSKFHLGPYTQVTPSLINQMQDYSEYRKGFDCIYELAAFQFYGPERLLQVEHLKRMLKKTGFALFLQKLSHQDSNEYLARENAKDDEHKSHYFTKEEILWKRNHMLQNMQQGQVSFSELTNALSANFTHVYVIWHSTNFYEFLAGDDINRIDAFLSLLPPPLIPTEFCFDQIVFEKVAEHGAVLTQGRL